MSKSTVPLILTEIRGRVALLRLNRPEAMNALNTPLMIELMDTLEKLDADEKIGAFVLTGDERAFAAGRVEFRGQGLDVVGQQVVQRHAGAACSQAAGQLPAQRRAGADKECHSMAHRSSPRARC